ncbi:RING-H2 finger protein ATL79-like [Cornus florida]|uniref:RING-H2 finger protein ATL79-like n=1 Tax=Cornus florida TaxID=4283 RepID=UPI00289C4E6A|nr:RING-H2 finger protein ATL79-like [Cornus florida]
MPIQIKMRPSKSLVYVASSPVSSTTTSPKPPTPPPKCDVHACPWWPYSNSNDFELNATVILIVLFSGVIFALALNAAIHFLRHRRHLPRSETTHEAAEAEPQPKPNPTPCTTTAPPTVVFSAGMKLGGAVAECAICLSEFTEGEGIHVLGRCRHGFHIQCIQEWLSSHSSCPTCRTDCHPSSSSSSSSSSSNGGGNESDSRQATA